MRPTLDTVSPKSIIKMVYYSPLYNVTNPIFNIYFSRALKIIKFSNFTYNLVTRAWKNIVLLKKYLVLQHYLNLTDWTVFHAIKLGKTQKRSKYHVFSYCLMNIELKNISKLEFPDRNFHGNVMLHKRNWNKLVP